jgi:chloramphenicol-sensitive protein RarD
MPARKRKQDLMAPPSRQMTAACAGLAANLLLGLSALFWKALGALPPTTLLGVRIVASLATLLLFMGALGRLRFLTQSLNRRNLALHLAAAMLVACNWLTFIRASIEGHVVESGLGYLLAPFIAIAAGRLVFGETMSRFRLGALLLIAGCVLLLAWRSQELQHQVYLTIGLSWGAYACIKKVATLDAFGGLLCETVVLALLLPALAWSGTLSLAWPPPLPGATWAMLAGSGLVSVLPLWLFSLAAARLPITTMGFFQFVLPLTQLLVALLIYRQSLSANSAVCFGMICMALLVILCEPVLTRVFVSARTNKHDAG